MPSSLRFRDGGRIRINVPRTTGSISLSLSWSNKQQHTSTKPTRQPLANETGKQEDVLKGAEPAARIHLSEETKRAMEMMTEEVEWARYIYIADFGDIEKLQNTGAGE